jgi:uncharacterized membrane protein
MIERRFCCTSGRRRRRRIIATHLETLLTGPDVAYAPRDTMFMLVAMIVVLAAIIIRPEIPWFLPRLIAPDLQKWLASGKRTVNEDKMRVDILSTLTGTVILVAAFLMLTHILPLDGKPPRFANTVYEPYIFATFCAGFVLGSALVLAGFVDYFGNR